MVPDDERRPVERPARPRDAHRSFRHARHCFGCGIDNPASLAAQIEVSDDNTQARAIAVIGDLHCGVPGIAHGGVVATLLDDVLGSIGMDRVRATTSLNVQFKVPVPVGVPIEITGHIVECDEERMVAEGTIRVVGSDRVSASATAVYRFVDRAHLRGVMSRATNPSLEHTATRA